MTQRIYLHGAGLNAASWGEIQGTALNLPGHGGRARAPKATAESFAETIAEDIPDDTTLIGHSFGGMVAMALAVRIPAKLRALILVDVPIRAPLKIISWYTPFVAPVVTRIPGMKSIAKVVGSRIENPEGQASFRHHLINGARTGLQDALVASGRFNGQALLPRLSMPTQVLCGARSLLTGAAYRENVRANCPRAEITELDTGHMIPFDNLPLMEAEITRFLEAQT